MYGEGGQVILDSDGEGGGGRWTVLTRRERWAKSTAHEATRITSGELLKTELRDLQHLDADSIF